MAQVSVAALKALLNTINGKLEQPPNSNRIFVWSDLIRWKLAAAWFMGQSYCAAGVVWTLKKLGIPIPQVSSPFYCPSRVQWARAHGRWISVYHGKAGDEVFYAWSASSQRAGLAEHVERLVRDVAPGDVNIRTFGFNTGSGTAGSQANGEGCWYRTRPINSTVLGVLRYSDFFTEGAPSVAPANKVKPNPWLAQLRALKANNLPITTGATGDVVRGIQWAVGCPVDGIFGGDTDNAVRLFQRYHSDNQGHHLVQDGEVGPLTLAQIVKITHFQH